MHYILLYDHHYTKLYNICILRFFSIFFFSNVSVKLNEIQMYTGNVRYLYVWIHHFDSFDVNVLACTWRSVVYKTIARRSYKMLREPCVLLLPFRCYRTLLQDVDVLAWNHNVRIICIENRLKLTLRPPLASAYYNTGSVKD